MLGAEEWNHKQSQGENDNPDAISGALDCHFTSIIDTPMLFICWKCKGQCYLHTFLPTSANIWTALGYWLCVVDIQIIHTLWTWSQDFSRTITNVSYVSRWSVSHPEEMFFEKYELDEWRLSLILKKGKLLLTVDWRISVEREIYLPAQTET